MSVEIWNDCAKYLKDKLPLQQFKMWINPLQVELKDNSQLIVYCPNRFVLDWVKNKYYEMIVTFLKQTITNIEIDFQIGANSLIKKTTEEKPVTVEKKIKKKIKNHKKTSSSNTKENIPIQAELPIDIDEETVEQENTDIFDKRVVKVEKKISAFSIGVPSLKKGYNTNVNFNYTFDNFVEGKSNQLARAAAGQVAANAGKAYNPLFLYGGTGLGKTHLLHAIGNGILQENTKAKVIYMHSERFVQDMVKAIQKNAIAEFKKFYRAVDCLLIDDIQFFAKKDRSQEEFFHTFNALLEGNHQIILTSDRYPKDVTGVEDRLKSRFGWGLTVAIEPPELETRVAILMRKAQENGLYLSDDVAFFIAKRLRSNVRELEGALNRVIANANFTGRPITIDFVREVLRDLLALHDKLVTIENIQKIVAEYYKIKLVDLLSKSRNRKLVRPRQLAMALSKELTCRSLPEIGDSFGGRDHTTVLHACRKVEELRAVNADFNKDFAHLIRILSS